MNNGNIKWMLLLEEIRECYIGWNVKGGVSSEICSV